MRKVQHGYGRRPQAKKWTEEEDALLLELCKVHQTKLAVANAFVQQKGRHSRSVAAILTRLSSKLNTQAKELLASGEIVKVERRTRAEREFRAKVDELPDQFGTGAIAEGELPEPVKLPRLRLRPKPEVLDARIAQGKAHSYRKDRPCIVCHDYGTKKGCEFVLPPLEVVRPDEKPKGHNYSPKHVCQLCSTPEQVNPCRYESAEDFLRTAEEMVGIEQAEQQHTKPVDPKWEKVKAPKKWTPGLGEVIEGIYLGGRITDGVHGTYTKHLIATKSQGVLFVAGTVVDQLFIGGLVKEGSEVRLVYLGSKKSSTSEHSFNDFDLFTARE